MAIMHPSDITKRKHVPSEEKFYNACKEQLSDKYHVFFSVRWYSEEDGRRVDSECDFLVFNPDYGFLCIECKGGKNIYVNDGTWYLSESDGDRKLRCSPYAQSEESMRFFKRYYEQETESMFPGVYGHSVVFPNYRITSPLSVDSPLALTIDSESIKALNTKLISIFKYFDSHKGGNANFLSPDSQHKFVSLINKRIALSIAAGALIEDKERELAEINYTQDVVIDFLTHYKRAFIIGGAGTGKSWIGIKKVRRAFLGGKKPLYLCSNPNLAARVRRELPDTVDSHCIDDLAKNILGEQYENAPIEDGCKKFASLFSGQTLPKYDLVVVDEAQDFSTDWADCANMLVKPNGELYVFYDESQNVYSRSFGSHFSIDAKPFVLRYNIRNTANIYQYTKNHTALGLDTISNEIEGVEPEVRTFTRKQAAISYIDATIGKLLNKEGVQSDKITVLINRPLDSSILESITSLGGLPLWYIGQNPNETHIQVSTVEDFKGLESDVIIYLNHTYRSEPQTTEIKTLNYTAFSRARFFLYVINYEIPM